MHRIETSTAAANMHGPGKNGFSPGNPVTATPSTELSEDWFNDVQENICRTIEGAGIGLVKGEYTQLYDAIQALIAAGLASLTIKQRSLIATTQTFAAGIVNGDPVRWDAANSRWAKALADGTSADLGLGLADVTNAEVVLYGETRAGLVSGLTPGSAYYLSAAGALATTPATDYIRYGVAKSATVMYLDIDPGASMTGVAYLAVSQVWTRQQSGGANVLTDAATIAWDLAVGQTSQVTLGGNRTLGAPTNQLANTYYSLRVVQDGSGSRTLAYNAAYKGVTGIVLSTAANAIDHLVFRSTGAVMELVAWRLNVGA